MQCLTYRPTIPIGDGALSLMGKSGWGVQRTSRTVRHPCNMLQPNRKSLIEPAIQNITKPNMSKSNNDLLLPLGNNSVHNCNNEEGGQCPPADPMFPNTNNANDL